MLRFRRPPVSPLLAVAVLLAQALAVNGCATSAPTVPAQRALYNDVVTLVRSQARDEWTLDRVGLNAIASGVAWSGCQTDAATREGLLVWLDAAITAEEARLGGPAADHWRRHRDLGEVADLIELGRVKKAVTDLHARAEAECPFWLEADPAFVGTQGNADRFTIWLESRGGGSLNVRGDALALSGGGAGRALVGGGISDRLTLMAGLELGGAGRFDLEGKVSAVFGAAVPVVLRFVDGGQVFDIEVAATTFLDPDVGLPPAIRVALAYGFVTPRVGGAFSPMATFWVGWEYHPPRGDDPPFHMIGLGTRIGVDIDP